MRFLILLTLIPLHAESRWHTWARRSISAASCAASAYDGWQTARMPAGVHEGNAVLSDHGRPRIGLMIGLKALLCLAPFAAEVWRRPYIEDAGLAFGTGTLGTFGFTVIHNYRVNSKP